MHYSHTFATILQEKRGFIEIKQQELYALQSIILHILEQNNTIVTKSTKTSTSNLVKLLVLLSKN